MNSKTFFAFSVAFGVNVGVAVAQDLRITAKITGVVGNYFTPFADVVAASGITLSGYSIDFAIYNESKWIYMGTATDGHSLQAPFREMFRAGTYQYQASTTINKRKVTKTGTLVLFKGNISLDWVSTSLQNGRYTVQYIAKSSIGDPIVGRKFSAKTNLGTWSGSSDASGVFIVSIKAKTPPSSYTLSFGGDNYYSASNW